MVETVSVTNKVKVDISGEAAILQPVTISVSYTCCLYLSMGKHVTFDRALTLAGTTALHTLSASHNQHIIQLTEVVFQ